MTIDFIRRFILMAILVLIQALVLNRIHLFGYATPLLYLYFVISYRRNVPYWLSLTVAFLLGMLMDSFTNTPGVASFSLTLVAFLQPKVLKLYLDEDAEEDFQPSISTMGWVKYITFAVLLSIVYCLCFFSLEAFSFYHVLQWGLTTVGSWLFTLLFILVVDFVRG